MLEHVVLTEQRTHGAAAPPPQPGLTARPPPPAPLPAAGGDGGRPRGQPRGRPQGRAVVGGVEYTVGGWGEYEISRRRERWAASGAAGGRPGARYAGRRYVHAEDVARDVLAAARTAVGGAAGRPSALQRAALRLADELARMEDRLCDADEDGIWECGSPSDLVARPGAPFALTIPPITSADLRAFAADPAQQDDPEDLEDLGDGVLAIVAAAGAREGAALPSMPPFAARGRPHLPSRAVPVSDDEAVLRLEAAVAPYVTSVEQLQAALASRLDAAADAVGAALRRPAGALGGRPGAGGAPRDGPEPGRRERAVTRGEEVDAAAGEDPSARLLAEGLPLASWEQAVFSLGPGGEMLGKGRLLTDGVCYGAVTRDDRSRTTALSPARLAWVAEVTGGRVYAWVYLDSAEAMYAIRARPEGDGLLRVDTGALVAWIRARLTGDPPHKVGRDEYVAHLRDLGFDVRTGRARDPEVRFDLLAMTSLEERAATLRALRALTQADFDGLDWAEYDRTAGASACGEAVEVAGDVEVDLARRLVSAPKLRRGAMWFSQPHSRSYVTYHTHPSGRFRGAKAEPPSGGDLRFTLDAAAQEQLAWHFISAPEGTYILRPTQALVGWYAADPEEAARQVGRIYEGADAPPAGPRAEVRRALAALGEAGFVARFHDAPCLALREGPDLAARDNAWSRREYEAQLARLAATSGEDLLRVDWSGVERAAASVSTGSENSWISAEARGEGPDLRVVPRDAHYYGDPNAPESYPVGVPGPLMVFYYAGGLPRALPRAGIEAARRGADKWAWVVFLGPGSVAVLRAAEAGVEVHGPRERAAPS